MPGHGQYHRHLKRPTDISLVFGRTIRGIWSRIIAASRRGKIPPTAQCRLIEATRDKRKAL